ncbi:NAD(P)-dependent alcohol dehydrogenase [Microbacterium sp. MPKO10]|uniref:NAD(P)-dependent alcohol dehydrogenase n=1 Tax=Microbacterium sp. MPKO10 TaxID=2989818 RepID=UPI0022358EFE|nr:NAD(P)-dependent alcohol dehydrogenase [Microbacterium sp. MPKO10]MCW4457393.1 NAD(P)-dependent alcohol dehydrogenase [Microbacterium sp. MPKO10]
MSTGTMRAAVLTAFGSPEMLKVIDVPHPTVSDGEVLVRVAATTVNGGELFTREGRTSLITGKKFPQRMGIDFTGEVAQVGTGIDTYAVGDRVWGVLPDDTLGAAAEYVAAPANAIAHAPESVSSTEAVSMLTGGLTALIALREKAELATGESLLVRGANGGVGSMIVQIGRHLGAQVTGITGPRTREFVTELGAEHVHDYARDGSLPDGRFDVIVDTVGRDLHRSRRLLARGGRMIAVALDFTHLFRSIGHVALSTVHGPRRTRFFRGKPSAANLRLLAELVDAGAVRPVVDTVRSLEDIADAHRALAAGGVRGKQVIAVSAR